MNSLSHIHILAKQLIVHKSSYHLMSIFTRERRNKTYFAGILTQISGKLESDEF